MTSLSFLLAGRCVRLRYYTLVSFLLNAFEVPLPPDAAPMCARS